ncbi:MAG TPA: IPT/TIG domain-containing protein [Solirubrobacteraceae bacterium]|nr:IPT/TIG domain-containing protein [Solirubrobacteraceae bacterium]
MQGNRRGSRRRRLTRAFILAGVLGAALTSPAVAGAHAGAPTAQEEASSQTLPARASAGASPRAAGGSRAARSGGVGGISLTPSTTRPYWVCPNGWCDAIVDPKPVSAGGSHRLALPDARGQLEGSGEEGGYDPQDLQSAYDIPSSGGAGETIAIVDAYGFTAAESALGVYRERYGLSPCTKADGCFRKVNQKGQESDYPKEDGWNTEQALDIEMVSAACPECRILLVQAENASDAALGEAENTAVRLGAIEVSNSWSSPEQECGKTLTSCEEEERDYYDHPGVMLFFAAGDHGYDNTLEGDDSPDFPAALPSVVAVGGTALHRASNARGWSEDTWYEPGRGSGGGSGCSRLPKPSWQVDPGCAGRMTDDVAADAACETPVSVYDGEWELICGTSASSPLLAGIEAHAEEAVRELPGAEAFYEEAGTLNDVTEGANGKCLNAEPVAYFCRAEVGYDGPTGMGTPEGQLKLGGAAPMAVTWPPEEISATQATLRGHVSPRSLPTTYWFEYGTTTAYGASVPVPEGSVGTSGREVSETVGQLQAETVYHYRLVASNADGTSYGPDYAFSTGVPKVASLAPTTGAEDGGETLTITGTNLSGASSVRFGSREASEFTVESDQTISVTVPAGKGLANVTVTTPAGTSAATNASAFVYNPPGPVLAWGENNGNLGDGETEDSDVPVEVSGLGEVRALASGWKQSLALTSDGELMGWGENPFGEVGDGTYEQRTAPVHVCAEGLAECPNGPYLEGVTGVSAGLLGSLALLSDGTVAAWGGNLYGDLATDTARNPYPLPVCTKLESPCKPENYLREVVEVAAGADFSLALLKDGTVMAWGDNSEGALGDGTTTGPEKCAGEGCGRVPVPVSGLSEVKAIAAGSFDALALLDNGTMMAWGSNERGQLGDGTNTTSSVPQPVCAIGEKSSPCSGRLGEVKSISAGYLISYALLATGEVAAWGSSLRDALGELKGGSEECPGHSIEWPCSKVPLRVEGVDGVRALAQGELAAGALVALEDGAVETWGFGEYGELGDGSLQQRAVPGGVCLALAAGPCPEGPYLQGQVTALASGGHDLIGLAGSPAPLVDEVTPAAGAEAGGTLVAIVGGNFDGATAVDFGAVPAERFEVLSDDEILAVAPPGSGAVNVTVTTPQGTSAAGAESRFTYRPPPTVSTGEASDVSYGEATLAASVNPNGSAVSECRFEYGATPSYGSSAACSSLPGAGTNPVAVSASIADLHANTTYYYRALASSAYGTSYGTQQSFTTAKFPEIGRCTKLSGKAKTGAYSSSKCTKHSAGEDSGAYEWRAWPLADPKLTLSGGNAAFVGAGTRIECAASAGSGEYTGPQTALLSLTLTGCVDETDHLACNSPGLAGGEVAVDSAQAELGFIDAAKPTIGWAINQSSDTPLASLECPEQGQPASAFPILGAAIAPLKTVDKMAASDALDFKTEGDEQDPERFQGGPKDALAIELPGVGAVPATLVTTLKLSTKETVEVRGLE